MYERYNDGSDIGTGKCRFTQEYGILEVLKVELVAVLCTLLHEDDYRYFKCYAEWTTTLGD